MVASITQLALVFTTIVVSMSHHGMPYLPLCCDFVLNYGNDLNNPCFLQS
jgi:hypothetical protein